MSKNQRRGNREVRKPKSNKPLVVAATTDPFAQKGRPAEVSAKKPRK